MFDEIDLNAKNYEFKEEKMDNWKYPLQYCPCSIIEKTDPNGNTHNELRVFWETEGEADLALDERSLVNELKNLKHKLADIKDEKGNPAVYPGPKLLFCITMYQEDWSQVLQSIAGCIRSIYELDAYGG